MFITNKKNFIKKSVEELQQYFKKNGIIIKETEELQQITLDIGEGYHKIMKQEEL